MVRYKSNQTNILYIDSGSLHADQSLISKSLHTIIRPNVNTLPVPIGSMYGIFTYVHLTSKSAIHVGKYTIHGGYGV